MGGATPRRWRAAMADALYGPSGFFVGADPGPAAHFRTSVHATPQFAGALLRLVTHVDDALGRPARLDIVDVGAGRAELLVELARTAPPALADRLRLTAVELAPRPVALPAGVRWRDSVPERLTGVLLATEWLDNVPLDLVEVDPDGVPRYLLVSDTDGSESLGPALPPGTGQPSPALPPATDQPSPALPPATDQPSPALPPATDQPSPALPPGTDQPSPADPDRADAAWLARWWPLAAAPPGTRAEIGRTRDEAWAGAVGRIERGLAVSVDYGHLAGARPGLGTLTGFRRGRQVAPVPDGGCDLTAHVAVDSAAHAGRQAARGTGRGEPAPAPVLVSQRDALRRLGLDGARPPLALAGADPAAYLRALSAASAAAELTDPAGLGGHWWTLQPVAMPPGFTPLPAPAPARRVAR